MAMAEDRERAASLFYKEPCAQCGGKKNDSLYTLFVICFVQKVQSLFPEHTLVLMGVKVKVTAYSSISPSHSVGTSSSPEMPPPPHPIIFQSPGDHLATVLPVQHSGHHSSSLLCCQASTASAFPSALYLPLPACVLLLTWDEEVCWRGSHVVSLHHAIRGRLCYLKIEFLCSPIWRCGGCFYFSKQCFTMYIYFVTV